MVKLFIRLKPNEEFIELNEEKLSKINIKIKHKLKNKVFEIKEEINKLKITVIPFAISPFVMFPYKIKILTFLLGRYHVPFSFF